MVEEEIEGPQVSEMPLHSDFERLGNLLTKAQGLADENNNYNPGTLRDYFSVLFELFRFMYPVVKGRESVEELKENLEKLNKVTLTVYKRLLSDKAYKVPASIFEALSIIHQDLLLVKQEANLGILVKKNLTGKRKFINVLK